MAGLFCASYPALAEDAISHPAKKPIGPSSNEMIPSLAVVNSDGATLQGNKLTLKGVSANSIVFADRPVRAAGHVLTSDFIKEWDEGAQSFAKDPPNATISVLSSDGKTVEDAVVTLKAPKLAGTDLTFEVSVLEGGLASATGPASLFIDRFAVAAGGFHGGGVVVGGARLAWRMVRPSRRGLRHRRGSWSCGRSGGGNAELLCSSGVRLLPLPALLSELLGQTVRARTNRRRRSAAGFISRRDALIFAEAHASPSAIPHRLLQAKLVMSI